MSVAELVGTVTLAGTAVGAVIVLARAGRSGLRMLRRLGHLLDDLVGVEERNGQPARPGIMHRLAGIEDRLSAVEAELHPNAGRSLHDTVTRIARATGAVAPGTHRKPRK